MPFNIGKHLYHRIRVSQYEYPYSVTHDMLAASKTCQMTAHSLGIMRIVISINDGVCERIKLLVFQAIKKIIG